jgi:hypothetical protein
MTFLVRWNEMGQRYLSMPFRNGMKQIMKRIKDAVISYKTRCFSRYGCLMLTEEKTILINNCEAKKMKILIP